MYRAVVGAAEEPRADLVPGSPHAAIRTVKVNLEGAALHGPPFLGRHASLRRRRRHRIESAKYRPPHPIMLHCIRRTPRRRRCCQSFPTTGGASSSHCTPTPAKGEASRTARTARSAQNASTPGIVGDQWPRAGWGPGSLTVSRPPPTAGAPGITAVSATAVAAALRVANGSVSGKGSRETGSAPYRSGPIASSSGVGTESEVPLKREIDQPLGGDTDVGSGERLASADASRSEAVAPLASEAISPLAPAQQPSESKQQQRILSVNIAAEGIAAAAGKTDTKEEPRKTAGATSGGWEIVAASEQARTEPFQRGDKSAAPRVQTYFDVDATASNSTIDTHEEGRDMDDDGDSLSLGVLLYNLDCGTLEPPSPDLQGTNDGSVSGGGGGGGEYRAPKTRREKRTMTSLYVR